MRWKKISDAVVRRLPLYLRVLDDLARDGEKLISSQSLGEKSGVGPALVRKDLAWFGEFGKQGVGYDIEYLRIELRKILNLESEIKVALVGAGSLGVALTGYVKQRFYEDESFNLHIVALFDTDPDKIGKQYYEVPTYSIDRLPEIVKEENIEVGILTVPVKAAQDATELLVSSGIKSVLNFVPTKLDVPEDVHVATADLSLELQRLAYYLQDE